MRDRVRRLDELPPAERRLVVALIAGRESARREQEREERGDMADWEVAQRRASRAIFQRVMARRVARTP